MTNMMMNGVVAINGGVGVMEIRQPLPQTVESVAQPVENLTVNAHKLTDRQQEIIQLYFYKGLNQYEIAEELGIVRPVVSKIMAAAIKRLKKSF